MKQFIIALICMFAFTSISFAQNDKTKKESTTKTTKTLKKADAKLICPVTGETAKKSVSYKYKGKNYYFCCKECITKFEANPTKYLDKKAVKEKCGDEEMMESNTSESSSNNSKETTLKVVNTKCPVMGEPVSAKGGSYEYNGKLYGFCCPGCKGKFAKDPEKYLKQL